jgi:enamine deaminase RidA (YjgF/YER057c/UK114 family)/catechol 2,3-dioxygenase-like lactoylglutathione lyase family enzyme
LGGSRHARKRSVNSRFFDNRFSDLVFSVRAHGEPFPPGRAHRTKERRSQRSRTVVNGDRPASKGRVIRVARRDRMGANIVRTRCYESLPSAMAIHRQQIPSGSVFEERIGYSRAVVSGDMIFVSGTTGFEYATMTLPEGVVAQCEQALANIERALEVAGASLRDVVRVRYILQDRLDFEPCWPVLRRAFGAAAPAATMIVAGLLDPRMRIEIEATARRAPALLGIDHVQLAAPPGCEPEARRFFGELLGLPELPKPPDLAARGGLWFQCGTQQLHVGTEEGFRPAKKAHAALRLRDEGALDALKTRLAAAGIVTRDAHDIEGASRFFAEDPWGNRLEFVATKDSRT